MRRDNPAINLAERAIRKRQIEVVHTRTTSYEGDNGQTPATILVKTAASPAVIGVLAGFFGAQASFGFNFVGAWIMGIEEMKLLRIFATLLEGEAALDPARNSFVTVTLLLHLFAGMFFGAIFVILTKRFRLGGLTRYVAAGTMFGIGLWLVNFYAILSWLQPLVWGEAFIVEQIPIWVAALTHMCYGAIMALVAFPFQTDL